jgi:hypothetical protein
VKHTIDELEKRLYELLASQINGSRKHFEDIFLPGLRDFKRKIEGLQDV